MTREQAVEILENMPKDIYTLDDITPTEIESWSLGKLHKQFKYKGDNQNVNIDCIVDWKEETFNLDFNLEPNFMFLVINSGRISGGSCKSASIITTTSPVTSFNPAVTSTLSNRLSSTTTT